MKLLYQLIVSDRNATGKTTQGPMSEAERRAATRTAVDSTDKPERAQKSFFGRKTISTDCSKFITLEHPENSHRRIIWNLRMRKKLRKLCFFSKLEFCSLKNISEVLKVSFSQFLP